LELNDARPKNEFALPPSGYYLAIDFGVGLGSRDRPSRGTQITSFKVVSEEKYEPAIWVTYFYYPLWRLEVEIWRIKTFGW